LGIVLVLVVVLVLGALALTWEQWQELLVVSLETPIVLQFILFR
jgi:hypothetical protein